MEADHLLGTEDADRRGEYGSCDDEGVSGDCNGLLHALAGGRLLSTVEITSVCFEVALRGLRLLDDLGESLSIAGTGILFTALVGEKLRKRCLAANAESDWLFCAENEL